MNVSIRHLGDQKLTDHLKSLAPKEPKVSTAFPAANGKDVSKVTVLSFPDVSRDELNSIRQSYGPIMGVEVKEEGEEPTK
jgi:hypothetical protein